LRLFGWIASIAHIVLRRMLSQRGLTVSLLLGWIAFVALASAIPMYSEAVNRQLLVTDLEGSPYDLPRAGLELLWVGTGNTTAEWDRYDAVRTYIDDVLPRELGVPYGDYVHYAASASFEVRLPGEQYRSGAARLGTFVGLEGRTTLAAGRMPEPWTSGDQPIEVVISQEYANTTGVDLGDERELVYTGLERDEIADTATTEYRVRVVGIWRVDEAQEPFWYTLFPNKVADLFIMDEASYLQLAEAERVPQPLRAMRWYLALDRDYIHTANVPDLLKGFTRMRLRLENYLPLMDVASSPERVLEAYQREARAQTLRLLSFLVPFLGLVAYFVSTMSSAAVQEQRLQIAMLKSRGATSAQVFATYLLQAAILAAIALAAGPPLGRLFAQAIGGTYGFLAFSTRTEIVATFTPQSWLFAAGGLVVAMAATVMPAIRASRVTVVAMRTQIARGDTAPPLWQRLYLDVLMVGIAAYGLYVLEAEGSLAVLESSDSAVSNPLLFLVPSFFVLALSLLMVRLFPWLVRLPDWIAKQTGGVSSLLALHHLSRSAHRHAPLLTIVLLTTALGTFTASAARTIDANEVDRVRFDVGADVALVETGETGAESVYQEGVGDVAASVGQSLIEAGWTLPPIEEHLKVEGVQGAARVGRYRARVDQHSGIGLIYGVDYRYLGPVAFFREDFANESLGALMNRLAVQRDGVLITEQAAAETNLRVGDTVRIHINTEFLDATAPFVVVGLVRYFPTAYPYHSPVFVANLDYIFEVTGEQLPYRVWLETAPGVDPEELEENLEDQGIYVVEMQVAEELVDEARREKDRMGVFGFLSVGFIITVGLSVLAQALNALMSFRQRTIEFGLARAIGLFQSQVASSLSIERAVVTLGGIVVGLGIGMLVSELFVPYLQIGWRESEMVPPFQIVPAWADVARAAAVMVVASVLTNGVIVYLLARIRVFEALKLGESLT